MVNLFLRQPFSECGQKEREVVQSVFDLIRGLLAKRPDINVITDVEAQSGDSFTRRFEQVTGQKFSAPAFRHYRFALLDKADAMICVRTALSESTAFEIAYNIFKGRNVPILICVWKGCPMKTTLLRDLDELCDITYVEFERSSDLEAPLQRFLKHMQSVAA